MELNLFLLLCAAALLFLFYALIHFIGDSARREPAQPQFLRASFSSPALVAGNRTQKVILFRQASTARQFVRNH